MATLPNSNITDVPPEAPEDVEFPTPDPINTFDLVGPSAANRQPGQFKTRDLTLRGRVNQLVANMNKISTGDSVDSAVLFLPRDGTNPMTGDLDMGGKQFTNVGVLLVTPTSTPDDYVQVSAGTYQKTTGKGYQDVNAQSIQITTSVGGGETRYDLVHIDDSGNLGVTQGVAGTPGVIPEFPDDELMLAVIKVDETGTIVVNDTDITDVRPFLSADQNARTLQDRTVDATAPSSGEGLVWDGAKWAPAVVGGWIVLNASGGSLSSQLNGNMVAGTRYWLEPGSWTLGADLTCSVADVEIAGSEATIIDAANYRINITAAGVKLDGFELQSTTASTTVPFVTVAAADVRVTGVLFLVNPGTAVRKYGIDWTSGNRLVVEKCCFDNCCGGADGSSMLAANTGGDDGVMRDCLIDLYNGANIIYGVNGTSTTAAKGFKIESCFFDVLDEGTASKVGVMPVSDWTVSDCRFEMTGTTGALTYGVYAGLDSTTCNRLHVVGNTFEDFFTSIYVVPSALTASDIVIENNIVDTSATTTAVVTGIIVWLVTAGSERVVIVGNTVKVNKTTTGDPIGVRLRGPSSGVFSGTISDNTVHVLASAALTSTTGIDVEGSHVTVSNNAVVSEGNDTGSCLGITFSQSTNIVVAGNMVHCENSNGGGLTFGISMSVTAAGNSYSVIGDNTVDADGSAGTDTGIYVLAAYVSITGNTCYQGLNTGIDLNTGNSTYCTVVGNVMVGAVAGAGGTGVKVAHNTGDATHTV